MIIDPEQNVAGPAGPSALANALRERCQGELLDLTTPFTLPPEASASERACADQLNALVARMRGETVALSTSISEASASTAYNAFHLHKMDQVADAQALEVQQIASAIQETSAGASQVARACENARTLTERLQSIAAGATATIAESVSELQQLSENVDRSAQAVRSISEYSERVGGLLEIVEDISAQTNLLAINAAIEAAHAGEHGRGFSVVADEIKKLADSTRKQTREITKLIAQVAQAIEQGLTSARYCEASAKLANERSAGTLDALKELGGVVDRSGGQVAEIAVVTEQQSSVLQTLSNNVEAAARHAAELARLAKDAGELELGEMTERSHHVLLRLRIDAAYEGPRAVGAQAAHEVETLLSTAFAQGLIHKRAFDEVSYRELDAEQPADRRHLERLFNVARLRAPIKPPKYTARYDESIDRDVCELLQHLHERHPDLKFVSFMDRNGLLLATARNLCEDWSGEYERDLAHNRIKRFFDDNFGLRTARVGMPNRDMVPRRATRAQFLAAGAELSRPSGARPARSEPTCAIPARSSTTSAPRST
ncbi:hypothetical protein EPN52_03965 [bacterium]|nr:MAG: hypothetical protein EPN52_03965 [bacterium]